MSRQYYKNHRKQRTVPLQRLYLAVAVLLLAVVSTFLWASTTLAKYTSTANGSSTKGVAAFVVEAAPLTSSTTPLALDTDTPTQGYPFVVYNHNENGDVINDVTTSYDVVVTFPTALSGVDLTLGKGNAAGVAPTTVSADQKTYTFQKFGTFSAGQSQSDALVLYFTLDEDTAEDSSWENISITVNAVQED